MEEIFNFKSVVELLMGDEEAAKDILQGFILQTDKHLGTLGTLLKSEDFENKREEIKSKAHLLKGSSLNISAKDFAQPLLEMERGSGSESREELIKLYSLICEKWKTLKKEIEGVIS